MTPAALAELHAECFETPRPWSAAEFEALLNTAFVKTAPQGFAMGRVIADEAELLTLAVAPKARRAGVGSGLMEAFLATSKDKGAASAFLEVAADNVAALALYGRHGFAAAGRRKAYYIKPDGSKLDAVIMTCPLIAR